MNLKQLKEKHNLAEIELLNQKIASHKVSFTANKLKQTESTHSDGQALRIIKDKKIGFTAMYGKTAIEDMINNALEVLRFSPEVKFDFPQKDNSSEEINTANTNEEIDALISFCKIKGEEIIETISSATESGSLLVDISFDVTNQSESLSNSKDLNYSYSNQFYSFSINLRETLENDFVEIFSAVTDNSFLEHKNYVKEALNLYLLSKNHAKIKSGSYPVLFTSKASKELIGIVEMALNGKLINQKSSPWHDKLGKKVLSPLISIKQEPKVGYMARAVDDEGSTVKSLKLVNNGILENFYFDLSSASRRGSGTLPTGTQSTGNGFKDSLTSQPEPNLLNMIINSGTKSLEQIIKNIDYGLLVDQTMGGLSSNVSGEISVNVDLGFLIEKGEIVGRVKDTMVSGNVYSALSNVLELSNTPKWYWSNIYSPDMLLGGLTITAKD